MRKVIATFSTKGGVGKSTILQQLILPAVGKAIYIDTDRMNASSVYVERSRYVERILRHPITEKRHIPELIEKITSMQGTILIDPPAADASANVLELLSAFDPHEVTVFVVASLGDIQNQERVEQAVEAMGLTYYVVHNRDETAELSLPPLDAVIDFAKTKRQTIYELAEVEPDEPEERYMLNLIKRVYAGKLAKRIQQIQRLIS